MHANPAGPVIKSRYMKKILALLIVFILMAGVVGAAPPTVLAENGTVVRVEPAEVVLNPGESTTIEVWVDDVVDLLGFEVKVYFDTDYVSASELAQGKFLDYDGMVGFDNDIYQDDGIIIFGFTLIGYDNIQSGSGDLFSFNLTANPYPGEFELEIFYSDLVDQDIAPIPHAVDHGSVTVVPIAVDNEYEVSINETLSVDALGVLANDILPEGVDYVAELVEDISEGEGELDLSPDGGFTYIPPDEWNGITTFTYRACHNSSCTEPATVTIHVVTEQVVYFQVFVPLILRH